MRILSTLCNVSISNLPSESAIEPGFIQIRVTAQKVSITVSVIHMVATLTQNSRDRIHINLDSGKYRVAPINSRRT